MTERAAKRIADLHQQYEDALAAYNDDPSDSKLHAKTITAAEKLAQARQADRVAQVEAGTRDPGMGVVADATEEG